jgi:hypothetical protein
MQHRMHLRALSAACLLASVASFSVTLTSYAKLPLLQSLVRGPSFCVRESRRMKPVLRMGSSENELAQKLNKENKEQRIAALESQVLAKIPSLKCAPLSFGGTDVHSGLALHHGRCVPKAN